MTDTQKMFKATAIDYLQHDGPVTVLRPLSPDTDNYDEEVGRMFRVRSAAGVEFEAFGDELKDIPETPEPEPEAEAIDDSPDPIILSEDDITIERNAEYIDVRMHDDTRPEHWPTIFASLTLDDVSARRVAQRLLSVAGPTIDEVVARVLAENPAAFGSTDAIRLAVQVARGEA